MEIPAAPSSSSSSSQQHPELNPSTLSATAHPPPSPPVGVTAPPLPPQPSPTSTSASTASSYAKSTPSSTTQSIVSSVTSTAPSYEEESKEYRPGGYHPVRIGDKFREGRYEVKRKLGWGHFSTVWLARDSRENRHVALKIVKSDKHYTETALDEIQLLLALSTPSSSSSSETSSSRSSPPFVHPGRNHVVQLLDSFRHTGPNGIHVCMVFEVLGESLLGLIQRHHNVGGLPFPLVKQIAKQVLLGLDFLHRDCQIIHTDLKPENVLVCIEDVESVVEEVLSTSPPPEESLGGIESRMVGIPASEGRGGAQTPRTEGIHIVGSQPLPSPSSSYLGTSQISFGMSSLEPKAGPTPPSSSSPSPGADQFIENLTASTSTSQSTTTPHATDSRFGEKRPPSLQRQNGPSLITQQAQALHFQASNNNTPNDSGFTITLPASPKLGDVTLPSPSIITEFNPNALHPPPAPSSLFNSPSPSSGSSFDAPPPSFTSDSNISSSISSGTSDHPVAHGDAARSHTVHEHLPQTTTTAAEGQVPLVATPTPTSTTRITVKIADLGNACWTDHHFTNDIQTRQYRSPEVILGSAWGATVDNWSAACLFFEMATCDHLFSPEMGPRWTKDDDHVAQIIELVGPFPRKVALAGKYSAEIFNRKAELRHISKLRSWPLHAVLQDKYGYEKSEAVAFAEFLSPMLNVDGRKRVEARTMVGHPWLKEVVEGEKGVEELVLRRDSVGNGSRVEVETVDSSPSVSPPLKP
ncbi:kinase-like domain-containing protein [Mrakia frigida]|uniref:kinase-like domain-containing protein n=1 Tax=Mrakia frigida TaxID=29902 RepID=UPI003FCBF04E